MLVIFLPFLTFAGVVAAIAGAYSILSDLYLRDRKEVGRRIDDEFRQRQREQVRKALLFKDLHKVAGEVAAEGDADGGFARRVETMIEQSGLDITPRWLLGASLMAVLAIGTLAFAASGSPVIGPLAGLAGAVVPTLYVNMKRKARLEKLLSQLPDAFDLMSRVIRAGQTTAQAILAVADEFPQPISGEFSLCFEQQNFGLPAESSLRDLARRTGMVELKIFVLALVVQQQTGGNLAEMLDKLSTIIRDRYRIRGQIRTLTAEGRLQAAVLLALPVVLFLVMLVLNRDYATVLIQHPSLIVATLVSEGLGALWIRKIINFDF